MESTSCLVCRTEVTSFVGTDWYCLVDEDRLIFRIELGTSLLSRQRFVRCHIPERFLPNKMQRL